MLKVKGKSVLPLVMHDIYLGHSKIIVVAGFRGRVRAGEKKRGGWSLRSRVPPLTPHSQVYTNLSRS
jgi:hypothetical protein